MSNVDPEGTYVRQLESRIDAFEEMNEKQWHQLGDQDKVIDELTVKVVRLRDTVVGLVQMYIDVKES